MKRPWLRIALVAIVYFLAAKVGLTMAFQETNASPVWPPTGVALAVVLLWGYRVWPGIFIGAFAANLLTFLGNNVPIGVACMTSAGIGAGNTLEAVAGVFLVRLFVGRGDPLDRARGVIQFTILAAGIATVASATIGVTSVCIGGSGAWSDFGYLWWTWWVGDAAGALVVTPFLLCWARSPELGWNPRRLLEAVLALGLLAMATCCPFRSAGRLEGMIVYPSEYLAIPFILWATFRFGRHGATTSTLLTASIAVWCTTGGLGPFVTESPNNSLLLLVLYLAVLAFTSSVLAGALAERKRAERDREQLIEELEARNAELDRFAYTVSHDLKSPLITITGYIGLLQEDIAKGDFSEAEESLECMSEAADRMSELLTGLLELSRIGRSVNPPEEVSMAALVNEAIALTQGQIQQQGVQIEVSADLPVVFADRDRLLEALVNLIDNGVKYMGDQPQPRINIGFRNRGPETVFFVRDNGIGIEPRHQQTVFDLFDQLDPRAEGSGVGLALVKRIIEVHGGKIWVESSGAGQGSTFCFTVPPAV